MAEKQYDNTNTGVLFKNEDKSEDLHADYRGNINVNGAEFWLDGWIKAAKSNGKKFMALRVKPKDSSSSSKPAAARAQVHSDDGNPF